MFLDVLLVLVLLVYAVAGYRRGLFATAIGVLGMLIGTVLGLWLLPGWLETAIDPRYAAVRPFLLVVFLLFLAAACQLLLLRIGQRAGQSLRSTSPVRVLDSLLGAVVTVVVLALVLWFCAGLLRLASPTLLGRQIAQSQVLSAIDRAVPARSDAILGRVIVALDTFDFPRVFSGIGAEPVIPADAPPSRAADTTAIARAEGSILRIDARAVACGRRQEGTGWVAAPGMVVTNAHVVAGSERVNVQTPEGALTGQVVAFDARRDLAVLSVDGLNVQALPLSSDDMQNGAVGAVAGYPLAGPYRVDPARVRGIIHAVGDDIYGNGTVQREVYALRAKIRPGNSGGPLLEPDGDVAGVVFARSVEDPETAYALTLDEVRPVISGVGPSSPPVGTGGCTS